MILPQTTVVEWRSSSLWGKAQMNLVLGACSLGPCALKSFFWPRLNMNCWHLLVCWLQVSDPEKVKSVLTPASAQFLDYRSSVDQDPSFAKHFPIPRPVTASLRVLEEMKQYTRSTKCLVFGNWIGILVVSCCRTGTFGLYTIDHTSSSSYIAWSCFLLVAGESLHILHMWGYNKHFNQTLEAVRWVADGTFLAATGNRLLVCDISTRSDVPLKCCEVGPSVYCPSAILQNVACSPQSQKTAMLRKGWCSVFSRISRCEAKLSKLFIMILVVIFI